MTQYTKLLYPYGEEQYELNYDESELQDANGQEYEFKFEYMPEPDGNGMIRITDSIGRYVPIDINHVPQLLTLMAASVGHARIQEEIHNAFSSLTK